MEIIDEIVLRNRLYERYLDGRSDEACHLFKTEESSDKLRRNSISNFYNHNFKDSKRNMIETWMIVNDLISDKGDKKNEEVCLSGCYHDDKSATVNKLGIFF